MVFGTIQNTEMHAQAAVTPIQQNFREMMSSRMEVKSEYTEPPIDKITCTVLAGLRLVSHLRKRLRVRRRLLLHVQLVKLLPLLTFFSSSSFAFSSYRLH